MHREFSSAKERKNPNKKTPNKVIIRAKPWRQTILQVLMSEEDNHHPTFLCHFHDVGKGKSNDHLIGIVSLLPGPNVAHAVIFERGVAPRVQAAEALPTRSPFRSFMELLQTEAKSTAAVEQKKRYTPASRFHAVVNNLV